MLAMNCQPSHDLNNVQAPMTQAWHVQLPDCLQCRSYGSPIIMMSEAHAEISSLICRMRPDFWPADAPSGLLNWTDEEEKRMLTMYALSGNKLTWMAATVWPSHKQDQLGSRRDIAQSDDTTTSADPGGRRNRFADTSHCAGMLPCSSKFQKL